MTQQNALVEQRSELLAKVSLTRRLNINVHPFDDTSEEGLNYICTIRSDRVEGFLPFGVRVWGTARELSTEADANAFGRQKWKVIKHTTFFIPVVVLLFSMQNDLGYFSWLVAPCKKGNKLLFATELKFKVFDAKQLNRMIERITEWYKRMAGDIVADTDEIDSAECANDD
jgi:hypothetical protein